MRERWRLCDLHLKLFHMRILTIFLLTLIQTTLFGQSLNNDNAIDQEDLKFLFEKNKLQLFKFSFSSFSDSSVNIIIEEYRSQKLASSKNIFEFFKPIVSMGDEP